LKLKRYAPARTFKPPCDALPAAVDYLTGLRNRLAERGE
jgi:hypothetical protein